MVRGEEPVKVIDGEESRCGLEIVACMDLENPVDGVLAGGEVVEAEAAEEVVRGGHMVALGVEEMVDGGLIIGLLTVGDRSVGMGLDHFIGVLGAVEGSTSGS